MNKKITTCATEKDDPVLYAKIVKAAEDLKQNGYAIIESLWDAERIQQCTNEMWDTLESMSQCYEKDGQHFDRARGSYTKFPMSNLLPHKHGICETAGLNHAEALRHARTDDAILRVFATLYGNTQLLGSMDRVNFKFPCKKYASLADWPHADQNPAKQDLRCVQAFIDLLGVRNEAEPGNRFYEGSHLTFAQFSKPWVGHFEKDWFKLTPAMIAQIDTAKTPLVKPCYPPGSLVLWDSRTIHSPSDGGDFARGRFVIYVCYLPYCETICTAKDEANKRTAFTDMRATPHLPSPQTMFPKYKFPRSEDTRYLEVDPCHLFAPTLKPLLDATSEARATALAQRMLPDEKEELLFGFKSYGDSPARYLWNKKWAGGPPLLKLVQNRVKTPLSKEVLQARKKVRVKQSPDDAEAAKAAKKKLQKKKQQTQKQKKQKESMKKRKAVEEKSKKQAQLFATKKRKFSG